MAHLEQIKGQCFSVPCYILLIKGVLEETLVFPYLVDASYCTREIFLEASETKLIGPIFN